MGWVMYVETIIQDKLTARKGGRRRLVVCRWMWSAEVTLWVPCKPRDLRSAGSVSSKKSRSQLDWTGSDCCKINKCHNPRLQSSGFLWELSSDAFGLSDLRGR